jgi:hypothetical protein
MARPQAKSAKTTANTGKKPRICAKRPEKPAEPEKPEMTRHQRYYAKNKEKMGQRSVAAYRAMSPADRTIKNWRSAAQPATPKKGTKWATDQRKVNLARAFCVWSDIDEVVRIHMSCAIMNELGWDQYRVDHMVPISSRLVCGLHTHTNLQVISQYENDVKGNHMWPDMPEVNWGTIDLLMGRS